jgi:hypothetical protein
VSEEGGVRREYEPPEIRRKGREDVDAESEDQAMSLFKRHIGRRATVVGVGVALLMLGLEAPAFAAVPTVAGISPASGPDGCIAVITGTGFTDSTEADTAITFNGALDVAAPGEVIVSATEIWVEVPDLLEGDSYTIDLVNNGGPASGGSFLSTSGAGGCAATIASFTPTCGLAGATVKITGTNLLSAVDPSATPTEVAFFDYVGATTVANHTVPNIDSATEMSVLVPSGAKDGPIRVTTPVGAVFSTDSFAVPPPDCPTGGAKHARSITLSLRKKLVARGKVSSTEDPAVTECVAAVPVKIQRRRAGGGWRTVGSTTTTDTGAYKKRIKNRHGKYRALAPKVTLDDASVCSRAVSPVRKH